MPTGGHSIEWFMRAVERLSVNLECLHSALGVLWGSVIHAAFLLLGQTHDCDCSGAVHTLLAVFMALIPFRVKS